MLELRNVSKRFSGIVAVDEVSFQAYPGEITGYLGPNGSGKSTTMKMITGLLETTSGHILFDGEPIGRDLISYKQRLGYVPEEPHLFGHLSGFEYLTMVGQLRNLPAKTTSNCIDGLLRLFSLYPDRHARFRLIRKACARRSCFRRPCCTIPTCCFSTSRFPDSMWARAWYCAASSRNWLLVEKWCCSARTNSKPLSASAPM